MRIHLLHVVAKSVNRYYKQINSYMLYYLEVSIVISKKKEKKVKKLKVFDDFLFILFPYEQM